tara:strand:- start:182 stop:577 length:396 start_codon:yes stop_codon:yes gene_type:complete
MPSIRKRIGYLPSVNIQEIITKIANKEKLSQSKVVGILVEEALLARGTFNLQGTNHLNKDRTSKDKNYLNNSSLKYHDLDELISDKGISYNSKAHKINLDTSLPKKPELNNQELFEQFKQFVLFQKMQQEQ